MVLANALSQVRIVGEVAPREGVPASTLLNIRQQWLADFGNTKVGCVCAIFCFKKVLSLKQASNISFVPLLHGGTKKKVDKDSRVHMSWIHERAAARAQLFSISGLSYERTLGAVKNIIPAVASTNAVIAAACVLEAYKCLTFSGQLCNTYLLYNGQSMAGGVSSDVHWFQRDPECMHCQDTKERAVNVPRGTTVADFVSTLVLAAGAIDLSTVTEGVALTPPQEPMVYDSEGDCFYCTIGKLGEMKAGNLSAPLSDFVDDGEVVTITEASWGKNVKRALKISHV